MRRNSFLHYSLKNRLLFFVVGLLLLSSVVIGVPSFLIAQSGLDQKGQAILMNSVEMALLLIETKNSEVESGLKTLEEAQEEVKVLLLGPKQADGTRLKNNNIYLGKNGYFIIYDQSGTEIMHPTMEGENVWNITFIDDPNRYLVQEQIAIANSGGGFLNYIWNYPNSKQTGMKYSYQVKSPYWDWIMVATAYETDFNVEADRILQITIISSFMLLLFGLYISNFYLKSITQPLNRLRLAMYESKEGDFIKVDPIMRNDEINALMVGYNTMVDSLEHVYNEIITRDRKINRFAYYDSMTNLPNRHLLEESMDRNIEESIHIGYFVLFEIRDFKTLNAIYGSTVGDQVIITVGNFLLENMSDSALYGRYEGNEFVGWFKKIELDDVLKLASELTHEVNHRLQQNNIHLKVEFYISYASYPHHGDRFSVLLQKANTAMRYAKNMGLLSPVSFTEEIYQEIEYETVLVNYAQKAIERNEFCVYYQEKVNSISHTIEGVEALARWNSKELGFVSPAIFIPIFSRSNLIIRLSEYVIRQALDDYLRLQEKYHTHIQLSVNISPIFFYKSDFTSFVLQEIEKRQIDPRSIILEITEDVFISEPELIHIKIKELRNHGIQIALDDFGTGYSSLNYLAQMELDEVKIDKSFIDHIVEDRKAYTMFMSIVNIAHSFGYKVVAEGVETKEQLDLVVLSGCNQTQGFYFSRPKPLEF